jgi:CHAT domain-containing protein
MDEAFTHIARTPNRLTAAVASHSLAVDSQLAGDNQAAAEQFQHASKLFSSLPRNPATQTFLFSAQVYQASLEAQNGRRDLALHTLQDARANYSKQSQYWVWLHYYQTLGDLLLDEPDKSAEAEEALRTAVSISEAALSSVASDTERLLWERHSSLAYRSLVQVELERNHDPHAALELWESYTSAPLRIAETKSHAREIDFAALESTHLRPDLSLVASTLAQLTDTTVISFAELSGGTVVWLFDDRGIHAWQLSVSPVELRLAVRQFLRLCSDPSSDVAEIRRNGRQLYDWLIGPMAEHLLSSRVLVVETDDFLQQLPFSALVTPEQEFLGYRYKLVMSPGLGFWKHLRPPSSASLQGTVLLIASSKPGGDVGFTSLPPLPDSETEVRTISASIPHSRVLLGSDATIEALRREIPSVSVLHFAGHAITSATRSGLVFAPSGAAHNDIGADRFLDAAQISKLAMPKLDLAVLSACATAGDDTGLANPQSLVRAFLRAGVPHVIASHWNVDSHSTSTLMQEFYVHLIAGERPAEALRSAAEIIRTRGETSHPYYWAAFDAFGQS